VRKNLTAEMALAIRVCIACIENEILPSRKSPFHKKLKEIYLAYRKKTIKVNEAGVKSNKGAKQ
jgi:hypothetical protein